MLGISVEIFVFCVNTRHINIAGGTGVMVWVDICTPLCIAKLFALLFYFLGQSSLRCKVLCVAILFASPGVGSQGWAARGGYLVTGPIWLASPGSPTIPYPGQATRASGEGRRRIVSMVAIS